MNLLPSIDERGDIVLTHRTLGKIATLQRFEQKHKTCPAIQLIAYKGDSGWFVQPYALPIYERASVFKSRHAAEAYAVALAHEMVELGLPKARPA